jgi:nitrite reductase (NADH) small subunit
MTVTPYDGGGLMTEVLDRAPVSARWQAVCDYDDLPPEDGVCALVHGEQVAIFRTHDGRLYALSNRDPFSGAYVLARGIVGSRGGVPTVASPMYKQVFDLTTGRCLDDPAVRVPVYRVRVSGTRVEVART